MRRPLRPKAAPQGRVSTGESIPAPVGGWDAVSPIAAMKPDRALVLDNWFPQPGYIEVRRGSRPYSIGNSDGPIESLMVYNAGLVGNSKMFSAADSSIYDCSLIGTAIEVVTGLSNARWQYTNFTTSGGHYLVCVNGEDPPQNYNGSAWSEPTITGSGITPEDFIHVNAHQNRLWFVVRDSMDAAYLPVNSISGTAAKFPLGAVCNKGGYLVAMTTWTHDGGNGSDDHAVFITSRGQVAVYRGTDPSSTDDWALVGVYDLGAPLGRRCFTKVAGDVALVNIDGVLPLSKALTTDRGAAAGIAITANINNAMNAAASQYQDNFGWQLIPYAKRTMAILNVPIAEGSESHQYVMNTLTGAWCRFKGWNANCFEVFNDNLYFGSNDGTLHQADVGAADDDQAIDAVGQTSYQYFREKGRLKQWKMIQPLVTTGSDSRPAVGISTDFKANASLGTPTAAVNPAATYDNAIWDFSTYPTEAQTVADWTFVNGIGQAASVHFRAQTSRSNVYGIWDLSQWDSGIWGLDIDNNDVVMRINAFNLILEGGEFL
jgi:hypothetical protein